MVDFLASLYDRQLDSRSVARHLATIRNFFRFALIEGYIEEDPAATIESPQISPDLPEFLSVEEVDQLAAAAGHEHRRRHARPGHDRADVLRGLRVSELCGLRVDDLQMDPGCLRCVGKGNKERLVPVGKQALAVVRQYLRDRPPEAAADAYRRRIFF